MARAGRRRLRRLLGRLRRVERRGVADLRDWLEDTRNLLHLSVLVFLPLLIALLTYLSNAIDVLPFLLFPPLAAGTHTLFAHPESRYASPRRFVGGLTTGALCGWVALEVTARFWYRVPPEAFTVNPGAAALGLFLTGAVTWALDTEESAAFSAALLVLVTGVTRPVYVLSVALSTGVIAAVFVLWRRHFYEQRARYLYRSTKGDDHVLVPMVGRYADATAMLAARLAGAHDAGKVVLLDLVGDEDVGEFEAGLLSEERDPAPVTDGGDAARPDGGPANDADGGSARRAAELRVGSEAVADLERRADRIEADVGVPCEVIVAVDGDDYAGTVLDAAREASCDLVVVPDEGREARPSGLLRGLFAGEVDVVLHRSVDGRERWDRVLVPVRRAGDVAHAMIDFARRLAGDGRVSVCHCIGSERERRPAEEMLANLVETVAAGVETRIARESVESFLRRAAPNYDLVVVGASTDRSAASRFVVPPTARRIEDVACDVAVVHRA